MLLENYQSYHASSSKLIFFSRFLCMSLLSTYSFEVLSFEQTTKGLPIAFVYIVQESGRAIIERVDNPLYTLGLAYQLCIEISHVLKKFLVVQR